MPAKKRTRSPSASGRGVRVLFAALPLEEEGAIRKVMFGYPCIFVGGRLCAGVHRTSIMMRLDDADRERFLSEKLGRPWQPAPGRVMRAYVCASRALLARPDELMAWIRLAIGHCRALPAPVRKPKSTARR